MGQKLKYFFGYVAMFLLVLSASIAFTINFTPLYSFDIDYLNIEQMTGLSKDIILDNYRILMQYLYLLLEFHLMVVFLLALFLI